jgi:RNA polymerase sigma factor (sigma-70 family)
MTGHANRTAALARTLAAAPTDPDLLAAFLDRRDEAAFAALVRRHGPLVLSTCRTILKDEAAADDAFQATFVALYRKAPGLRRLPSLAGWLFGAARNCARHLRRAADRQARRDRRAGKPEQAAAPDLSWREACAILHAEIDRLPDCYRLPLVLCHLQGLARDEAARRLGWTMNEVRGRLERGRSRLRVRLQQRGIALSVGLFTVVAADAVSPALVRSTMAATRVLRPASVFPIVAGLWKTTLAAGLAAAVVFGLALPKDGANAQPVASPPKSAEPAQKAEPETPKTVTVSGVVVAPNGSGVCMAKVIIRRQDQKDADGVTAVTGPDGRFVATIPAVGNDTAMVAVSVGNEAFAAGWHTWRGTPPKELRLVEVRDDVPVQGRVLDLEGKPVGGVTITVQAVHAFPAADPQAFVDWLAGNRPRPTQNTLHSVPQGGTASATTGADGKFRLTGIGRDRVAQLLVAGPTIAHETIHAATVAKLADAPGPRTNKVYPATFDYLAAPARPVRGVARDIDTGKPVPGLEVNGFGGAAVVTTDKEARYELPGQKKGPRYTVYARPADGSVYFPTMAEAADTGGLDPLDIDLKVKAGVPVRGRLKDAKTGKPVVGTVRYWAFGSNPNVGTVPLGDRAGEYYTVDVRTKPDGTFTCAALPGPGFLTVTAGGWYQSARVDPQGLTEEAGLTNDPDRLSIAVGGGALSGLAQEGYEAILLLKVDADHPPAEQVIELTPAEPIRGRLVGPDGKPLDRVNVRGLHQTGDHLSEPLPGAEFQARPPHPERPRRLMFRHDGRKLVGSALVKAGSAEPVEFKLEPWASVTGRLLDTDGRPVARAMLYVGGGRGNDPRAADSVPTGTVYTNATGKFTLNGLLPGVPYKLGYRVLQRPRAGGPATDEFTLKPGEGRDLGDLRVPAREGN